MYEKGAWTGNAIRMLTPTWSTDVAGDFLAATCPKVVATDPADAIIADASSLKAGVALAREITKGATKGIGWCTETPIEYRMADWENVGVNGTYKTHTHSNTCPSTSALSRTTHHLTVLACFIGVHIKLLTRRFKIYTTTK
jgi:hypothetical protein